MLTAKTYALLYKYKHSAEFERFAECGVYNSKRQARWELAYFLLVGRSVGLCCFLFLCCAWRMYIFFAMQNALMLWFLGCIQQM